MCADLSLCAALLSQVSQAEVLIEERDEEIRKIVETIAELAQIMRDLSTLVVEQGTMLDRIDTNITQAAVKVRAGRGSVGRPAGARRVRCSVVWWAVCTGAAAVGTGERAHLSLQYACSPSGASDHVVRQQVSAPLTHSMPRPPTPPPTPACVCPRRLRRVSRSWCARKRRRNRGAPSHVLWPSLC